MNHLTKPPTTKLRIIYYLQTHTQASGSELEMQAPGWLTKPSVISRRARELAQEGKIERLMGDKGTVQYRIIRPSQRPLSTAEANNFLRSLA